MTATVIGIRGERAEHKISMMGSSSTSSFVELPLCQCLLLAYLAVEVAFYAVFRLHLMPRSNVSPPPPECIAFGRQRRKLLLRLLERTERTSRLDWCDMSPKACFLQFLSQYFETSFDDVEGNGPDGSSEISVSDDGSLSDEDETSGAAHRRHPFQDGGDAADFHDFPKESIDELFSWMFFNKLWPDMEQWELNELQVVYEILNERLGLTFEPATSKLERERYHIHHCLLHPSRAMHRPLMIYMLVWVTKTIGDMVLLAKGFQRHVSSTGLVAWHKGGESDLLLPMLCFHGITPGGLTFNLPMFLSGLATEPDRPVIVFENKSISSAMSFVPLSAQDTIDGVDELLRDLGYANSNLQVVGHSFGSCTIAWLVASGRFRERIRQITLVDPTAILVGESDVLKRFMYGDPWCSASILLSSELFIEYYLRRHFTWYNSEFWLEDVCKTDETGRPHCKVLICISGKDSIINSPKIKNEVDQYCSVEVVYWPDAPHGACGTSVEKWNEMKQAMLRQELKVLQA